MRKWHVYHVFGSEELSSFSPSIRERAPEPYVELHPEDATTLGLDEGSFADLTADHGVTGTVKLNENLAKGVLAIPVLVNVNRATEVVA